jgi:alpha-D-xyloside xylohydrolase
LGLFVHTAARVTHGGGYSPWSHRSYVIKLDDPNLDLFLLFADSPAEMLQKYTALTGRTELPPTWSYGAWFSRAIYKTADEILEVAQQLRERRIPADVLTLDGRAWHKSETRFDFSWDPDRYPDPAGFVRTCAAWTTACACGNIPTFRPSIRCSLNWRPKNTSCRTRTAKHTCTAGCLRQTTA